MRIIYYNNSSEQRVRAIVFFIFSFILQFIFLHLVSKISGFTTYSISCSSFFLADFVRFGLGMFLIPAKLANLPFYLNRNKARSLTANLCRGKSNPL